jgi:hypothetical protein
MVPYTSLTTAGSTGVNPVEGGRGALPTGEEKLVTGALADWHEHTAIATNSRKFSVLHG